MMDIPMNRKNRRNRASCTVAMFLAIAMALCDTNVLADDPVLAQLRGKRDSLDYNEKSAAQTLANFERFKKSPATYVITQQDVGAAKEVLQRIPLEKSQLEQEISLWITFKQDEKYLKEQLANLANNDQKNLWNAKLKTRQLEYEDKVNEANLEFAKNHGPFAIKGSNAFDYAPWKFRGSKDDKNWKDAEKVLKNNKAQSELRLKFARERVDLEVSMQIVSDRAMRERKLAVIAAREDAEMIALWHEKISPDSTNGPARIANANTKVVEAQSELEKYKAYQKIATESEEEIKQKEDRVGELVEIANAWNDTDPGGPNPWSDKKEIAQAELQILQYQKMLKEREADKAFFQKAPGRGSQFYNAAIVEERIKDLKKYIESQKDKIQEITGRRPQESQGDKPIVIADARGGKDRNDSLDRGGDEGGENVARTGDRVRDQGGDLGRPGGDGSGVALGMGEIKGDGVQVGGREAKFMAGEGSVKTPTDVNPDFERLADDTLKKLAVVTGKDPNTLVSAPNQSAENLVRITAMTSLAGTGAHIEEKKYESGDYAGLESGFTCARTIAGGGVLEVERSEMKYGAPIRVDESGKALPTEYEDILKDPGTGDIVGYVKKQDITYKDGKEDTYQELVTRNIREVNPETGQVEDKQARTLTVVRYGESGKKEEVKATTVRAKKSSDEWGDWKQVDVKGEKNKVVKDALNEINNASDAAEKSGGGSNGAKAAAHKRQAELREPLDKKLADLDRLETSMQQDNREIERTRLRGAAGFKTLPGAKVEGPTEGKLGGQQQPQGGPTEDN